MSAAPHGKTPWNPSRTATARVPDPLPAPSVHEACGSPVEIVHHDQVYGRAYSDWPWVYRCSKCDASVGMHPFTAIPLGTLAGPALRATRKACKLPFERLWLERWMSRREAYRLLAQHLGIAPTECHFGMFDEERCRAAAAWARAALVDARRRGRH